MSVREHRLTKVHLDKYWHPAVQCDSLLHRMHETAEHRLEEENSIGLRDRSGMTFSGDLQNMEWARPFAIPSNVL